jgi:hypothetical protein
VLALHSPSDTNAIVGKLVIFVSRVPALDYLIEPFRLVIGSTELQPFSVSRRIPPQALLGALLHGGTFKCWLAPPRHCQALPRPHLVSWVREGVVWLPVNDYRTHNRGTCGIVVGKPIQEKEEGIDLVIVSTRGE